MPNERDKKVINRKTVLLSLLVFNVFLMSLWDVWNTKVTKWQLNGIQLHLSKEIMSDQQVLLIIETNKPLPVLTVKNEFFVFHTSPKVKPIKVSTKEIHYTHSNRWEDMHYYQVHARKHVYTIPFEAQDVKASESVHYGVVVLSKPITFFPINSYRSSTFNTNSIFN
ncbi:hypothetical protein ACFSCX_24245 [Bacillus salitolerans]|uniref:Uncharacterized protein n=1 Tax=Bacillus salitolerans TaxID=1437434 RepID=A0ABW4LYG6_9BACI